MGKATVESVLEVVDLKTGRILAYKKITKTRSNLSALQENSENLLLQARHDVAVAFVNSILPSYEQ